MFSALPSATAAWSSWRTIQSPSVTVQPILDNSSYVRSRLKNLSTAFYSMCCPKASSRCATSVFLHLAAANAWLLCVNDWSRSTRRNWASQKLLQNQPIQPQSQSCAAQVAASQCFFNEPFNPLGVAHHEPLWFLPSDFLLDAGFQSCAQASIRLSPGTIHPNHFFASFLAWAGWLFGCTINVK